MDRLEGWGWGVVLGVALAAHGWGVPGALAWTLLLALLQLAGLRWRALAVLAGLLLGMATAASVRSGPLLSGALSVEGVVSSPAVGRTVRLSCRRWRRLAGATRACAGTVELRLPMDSAAPRVGTPLVAWGQAGPVSRSVLPGEPDPIHQAALAGVRTVVRARSFAVLGAAASGPDPLQGATYRGVLAALARGDRREVREETVGLLRRTGTSHLLAISGFHVGLVAGVAGGALGVLVRASGLLRAQGLGAALPWLAAAAGAWTYALAAGAPVSALRAAGMVSVAAAARALARRAGPGVVLGSLAGAGALLDPAVVTTPGFQLSFGAVVGLVRVTPRLTRLVPPDVPRPLLWAISGSCTSIAATAGTLPAALWWFQQLAPVSILANLWAVPFVGTLVAPAALVAAWGPAPLSGWALPVADAAAAAWIAGLGLTDLPPWPVAAHRLGAVACVVPLVWPRRLWPWVLAGLVLALGRAPTLDRVTFLDVGQGDAALVRYGGGGVWLVDGGPGRGAVLRWLRRQHLLHLDVVVATHGHPDHTRGLEAVLEELSVGELWLPEASGLEALEALALRRGVTVVRPGQALSPRPGDDLRGLNERSLVLEGRGVLWTGDVERHAEALLAERVQPVRVLKVPHHGSRTSSSPALLDAALPELAVVSAGVAGRFGHPHDEVVQRYLERHIPLCRTDVHGTIEVELAATLRVRTWRAGRGWSRWQSPAQACGDPGSR